MRKRIERLIQDENIRIIAVLNPRTADHSAKVIVGIRANPGRAQDVAAQLLPLNEVVYVGYVTGRFDLIVELLLRDEAEMLAFLSQRLGEVPGIASIETFHILRADKINYDWKLPTEVVPALRSAPGDHRATGSPYGRRAIGGAPSGIGRRSARCCDV